MSLLDQVQNDTKDAMRAGDRERVGALRLIANELQKAHKDGSGDQDDGERGAVASSTVNVEANMRNKFDKELELLNEELIEMGNIIESSIETAVTALIEQNIELAKRVVEGDKEVNDIEKSIERRCLKLLLQQQPVASDLRMISSALKMMPIIE